METILQRNRDIDGVIAGNDTMALGAVAALKAAGLPARSWSSASTAARTRSRDQEGQMHATVLQPAAQIARDGRRAGPRAIKTGKTGQPEKQSIDCELVNKDNADTYTLFALQCAAGRTPRRPAPLLARPGICRGAPRERHRSSCYRHLRPAHVRRRHLALRHLCRPLRHRRLWRAAHHPRRHRPRRPGPRPVRRRPQLARSSAATSPTTRSRRRWTQQASRSSASPRRSTRGCSPRAPSPTPTPACASCAHDLITEAADVVRYFGADYVKLWPGQDGWDYPFQVDYGDAVEELAWTASAELAAENPDLKFVIEYKPREPRVHMSYRSVARTLLGIEKIGLPNVGILLDFGHALFGGSRRPTRRNSPSTTAGCSAWTSTTTCAAGTTTWSPAPCTRSSCSSSSTPWRRTTGRASGSSTSSRSARTAWPRRTRHRLPQGGAARAGQARHRGAAGGAGAPGRDGRPAPGPGRPAQLHGHPMTVENTVGDTVEEDLVPEVHPDELPGPELPVLGRIGAEAGPEAVAAHLREAGRVVRRRDIQMVRAAGLGHIGGEFSVIDILVTLYLHSMNIEPGDGGRPRARPAGAVQRPRRGGALHDARRRRVPAAGGAVDLHAAAVDAERPPRPHQDRRRWRPAPARSATDCRSPSAWRWRPSWTARRATFVVIGDGEMQEGSNWEAP